MRKSGSYWIFGDPLSESSTANYKGLYRREAHLQANDCERFMDLLFRSIEHVRTSGKMWITDEISLAEMLELAELATRDGEETFEVIYFSEECDCPHDSVLYGLDVAGVGGYSVLGERLVCRGTGPEVKGELFQKLYKFPDKANRYGLLDKEEDAVDLRDSLKQYNRLYPGYIEEEDWKVFYIFKVIGE